MTRDTVIRLAREAGMGGMLTDVVCTLDELEKFYSLVISDQTVQKSAGDSDHDGVFLCGSIEPQPVEQPAPAQTVRKPMTRNDIKKEFDSFIEFPSDSDQYVTTTSALLFAEHIAALCIKDAPASPDAQPAA